MANGIKCPYSKGQTMNDDWLDVLKQCLSIWLAILDHLMIDLGKMIMFSAWYAIAFIDPNFDRYGRYCGKHDDPAENLRSAEHE